MARHKDEYSDITNYTENWEGKAGAWVEDAVTKALNKHEEEINTTKGYKIKDLNFAYNDNVGKLTITTEDNSQYDTEITVEQPSYEYGIYIYGVRVTENNKSTIYTSSTSTDAVAIQYKSDKTFEVGVAPYAIGIYASGKKDVSKTLKFTLSFGNSKCTKTARTVSVSYLKINSTGGIEELIIPEGEKVEDIVKWVSIDELFSTTQTGSITATLDSSYDAAVPSYTLKRNFNSYKISLVVPTTYYTNEKFVTCTLQGAASGNFYLQGMNGTESFNTSVGSFSINLNSGINKIAVRAVLNTDKNTSTDFEYFDVICTSNCEDTVIAVNKVSSGISNNAIATLYNLTVYSPNKESCTVATYLSEVSDDQGSLLKEQVIEKENYNSDNIYTTTYYKYIENNNSLETARYLRVYLNKTLYQFYTIISNDNQLSAFPSEYKTMNVAPVNNNYCYYNTGVLHSFDQITGRNDDVFTNASKDIEVGDGYIDDSKTGVIYFKVSAQENPILTLSDLNLGNNFTLEFKFKTYNISDSDTPIITLGKMQLTPTEFTFDTEEKTSRNSIFREETITHLMITVTKDFSISKTDVYYPKYMGAYQKNFDEYTGTINLVRIFINGVIDREYVISDDELSELRKSSLILNPTTADINFYVFRIYNQTALDFTQVQSNYISALWNDVTKESDDPKGDFYEANNILSSTGEISYNLARQKYNTLLFVFPKDPQDRTTDYLPTRAWGGEDNSDPHPNDKCPVTLFINYIDSDKNKKYGGRLSNVRVRGQGTSAMRYWIWNPATHLNKVKKYIKDETTGLYTTKTEKVNSEFIPYSNLDTETNQFVPEDQRTGILKKYYLMPDEDDIKVTKLVGKVNYASSMQTHKIGSTDLYNNFYKNQLTLKSGREIGGKKCVKEEPFLYFYTYADRYDLDDYELSEAITADNKNNVHFMGFLTWGSGKGDNETFAIDSNKTPGYLFLEGGDNGDYAVQFQVPWQALQRCTLSWEQIPDSTAGNYTLASQPQLSYDESLEKPWEHLYIGGDESICYTIDSANNASGAWDVNQGLEEIAMSSDDDGNLRYRMDIGTNITDEGNQKYKYLRNSMIVWRKFYDFVYTHDWNIWCTGESDPTTSDGVKAWNRSRKICCTNNTCTVSTSHKAGDVYRYDSINGTWVPAGEKYIIDENGNGSWSSFNLFTYDNTNSRNETIAKAYLRKEFYDNIGYNSNGGGGTLHIDDACIHQALIRLLSGTDNRAKNTYFRVVGPVFKELDAAPTEQSDSDDKMGVVYKDGSNKVFIDYAGYDDDISKYHFVDLLQDDLDTVLATDNNGLQTKPYNLLEPSYYNDKATSKKVNNVETDPELSAIGQWGDDGDNVFFRCFDQVFESQIIDKMNLLLSYSFETGSVESGKFYDYFFKIQKEIYPAVAYNHTAKIYYELGQLILNSKVIDHFNGNNQQPIKQSHGSCVESEMNFMQKRYAFLGSQCKSKIGNNILTINTSGSGSSEVNMKFVYKPYQDFYPILKTTAAQYYIHNYMPNEVTPYTINTYSNYEDSIARKHLTQTTGGEYTDSLSTDKSVQQYLQQLDLYSELQILGFTGTSLKANYTHLTKFTIDNSQNEKDGYAISSITESDWVPNFPVAKTIELKYMTLPASLDFSNCLKLETLDLTGSSIQKVILPSSGHLKTVILPNSVTNLVVTNNPNLETLTCINEDEDSSIWSNLTTLDINCNKIGSKFDLTGFLHQLTNASKLTDVTLSGLTNQNISITLLQKLLSVSAKLTGSIKIVDDGTESNEGTLYGIDLTTKSNLAYTYGNIDSESNSIYIKYKTISITDLNYDSNLYIFGEGYKGNVFGITTTGNNVKLIKCDSGSSRYDGKYIPQITYNWTSVNKVATLDSQTGEVEMLTNESDKTTTANFTLTTTSGNTISKTGINITFKWVAPQMGDFVYADGTYASSYKTTSTLVGIVYAVDNTESTEDGTTYAGTAYVLGTDWSNLTEYPLGYTQGAVASSDNTTMTNLYYVREYLQDTLSITDNYYDINQSSTKAPTEEITGNMNIIQVSDFDGKDRTYSYIKKSNTVLKQLYNISELQQYIKYTPSTDSSDGIYVIKDLNSLGSLVDYLRNISKYTTYTSCILYPYFWEIYLYQPTVKSGETLNSQFKAGNWYVPSAMELGYLMYCKGVSTDRGTKFLSSQIDNSIDSSQTSEYAIYSIAYGKGYTWDQKLSNLFNMYYASSTCGADGDGCYQYYNNNYYGSSNSYSWNAPYPTTYDYNNQSHYRTVSKIPIHCVQFKYQKQTTSN